MNQLSLEKRIVIINLLVEGSSHRAISRITGVSTNTISKLLVATGSACLKFHDEKITNVNSKRIECDEIWSYVYAKQRNVPEKKIGKAGDVWTWTGIDVDSKLIISWYVGNRDADSANIFIQDLACRIKNRVQLTTDGFKPYLEAVENTFGADIDFAQLVKLYGNISKDIITNKGDKQEKYPKIGFIGTDKTPICGNPNMKHISTSCVERQNLTMRMHMRRFTRSTNAFSKKIENHCYAIALYFVYYNFCKIHKTLRVTPAMEAGIMDDVMEIKDIIALI